MSREAQAIFSLLLMAACAATGLANVSPQPSLPHLPKIPCLLPPRIPGLMIPGIPCLLPGRSQDDIAKCWSSLESIPGCEKEILASVLTGKFGVGSACCNAFLAVAENCLLKMFPFAPFFPPLLKSHCAQGNVAPAKAVGN